MTRRRWLGRVLVGLVGPPAALAACGTPEPVARTPAAVLGDQLAAERALQGIIDAEPEAEVHGLAARSRARAARLVAAGAHGADVGWMVPGPDLAYGRLLVVHVAALPQLPPRLRGLAAELLRDAAADQATLRARAGREPVALPFPGRPSA